VQAYARDPWAFVARALGERGWVEEMSGLAEVQRRAVEGAGGLEWDREDGGGSGGGGLEDEGELL